VVDPTASAIIARWDFNSLISDANAVTGVTTPAIGAGTAALVGGATGTFAGGSGSDTNAADNSGWNTATYPAQSAGNKTRGVQFAVSTAGKQKIAVTFDERASGSASKYVRLQYSTNGTTYTDYPITTAECSESNNFESKSNSLAAIAGVNDNPNFSFRLLSEFDSTAATNANANYVTPAGSMYGDIRHAALRSGHRLGRAATRRCARHHRSPRSATARTGISSFTLGGATGSTWIVQASADLTNWVSLVTNTVPFFIFRHEQRGSAAAVLSAKLVP